MQTGYEAWVKVSFGVAVATLLVFVALGSRPGAPLGPLLYRQGMLVLAASAAGCLAFGLVRCLRQRPALQRRRLHGLLVAVGTLWAASFPLPYPSSHEGKPGSVELALPFAGERGVRWAGDKRADNLLILDPARRFGIAFEGAEGEQELRAPVAAEVVRAGDDFVVLEVAQREFLVLAGLEEVAVGAGERLAAGQPLGASSASGFALHLQDRPDPGDGEGIPLRFAPYLVDRRRVRSSLPVRGQRVANVEGTWHSIR